MVPAFGSDGHDVMRVDAGLSSAAVLAGVAVSAVDAPAEFIPIGRVFALEREDTLLWGRRNPVG